ncbi:MAG: type II toxin-antitoxin system VapC family toxin [Candidatus Bathyarchaeota archaeon]|nr:type II toxin-antitoxin system VapC family toxin [Candidatus Bathyarchaeota archaeon]
MTRFIDTNIFLYAMSSHPEFVSTARSILKRVEKGEPASTSIMVLSEIAWVFEARGQQSRIQEAYELILSYENLSILEATTDDLIVASVYVNKHNIDFNDAVNLSIMKREGINEIYSNDKKHLGNIPEIMIFFE